MTEMCEQSAIFSNEVFGAIMIICSVISLGMAYVLTRYSRLYTDVLPLTFVSCTIFVSIFLQVVLHGIKMVFFRQSVQTLKKEMSIPNFWRELMFHGSIVGIFFTLQWIGSQYAMVTITTGQTSFIIGMYVIFVPIAELALRGFQTFPPLRTWLSALLVFIGIYFLSDCSQNDCFQSEEFWGVLYAFGAMLAIVGQIIASANGVSVVGATSLVFACFCFGFLFSFIPALIFENQWYTSSGWTAIFDAWMIILLSAITDIAATLFMTIGLEYLSSERASILLSLDSLSGAFFGWLVLGESFYGLEYLGGSLMLLAVFFEFVLNDDIVCILSTKEEGEEGGAENEAVGEGHSKSNGERDNLSSVNERSALLPT